MYSFKSRSHTLTKHTARDCYIYNIVCFLSLCDTLLLTLHTCIKLHRFMHVCLLDKKMKKCKEPIAILNSYHANNIFE